VNAVRVAVVERPLRASRTTLAFTLEGEGGFQIIGPFDSARAAVAKLKAARAEVATVKLGSTSLEAIALLKQELPQLPTLVLMRLSCEQDAYRALSAGASGCLAENCTADRICSAIVDVLGGGMVIEPEIAKGFWRYLRSLRVPLDSARPGPWRLSAQELQILLYLAKGLSNAEVARLLSIGRRSVRTRLSHIYREMGVRSHLGATFLAARAGLIEL
jgi:DNA-binding NarL/FixJ family response regulator